MNDLLTITEARRWIKAKFNLDVGESNISYLIQYGRISKINGSSSGEIKVKREELDSYYSRIIKKETDWKQQLGIDLDWHLSFERVKEKDRTKHVHRLHPYKGKFIPQLVEYFLDEHTDEFKKNIYFKKGDLILDPFCGSGTTLVQANELGINAIGIDISEFNSLISNVKVQKHNLFLLNNEIEILNEKFIEFVNNNRWFDFENELSILLNEFNKRYFPSPDYAQKIKNHEINENKYGPEKENEFLKIYLDLLKKHKIKNLFNKPTGTFFERWYIKPVKAEISYLKNEILRIQDKEIRNVVFLILSRTIRSCRATKHEDLATLVEPVENPYYCHKHYKICKPLFTIRNWWEYYIKDALKRFGNFYEIRTNTFQHCFTGDARVIDLLSKLKEKKNSLFDIYLKNKIKGIFTSPPYVGMIDYHEQHAYAYELLEMQRRDHLEIGSLRNGKGNYSRERYINDISSVFINCRKYLANDFDIFIVANDSYNLYPKIVEIASMKIVQEFRRPVLCRTEKDKAAYSEKIFHIKDMN